jgi:hypothetical protein
VYKTYFYKVFSFEKNVSLAQVIQRVSQEVWATPSHRAVTHHAHSVKKYCSLAVADHQFFVGKYQHLNSLHHHV